MPDWMQRLVGLVLAVVTLPLMAVLIVLIRVDSLGPGIYRAQRMGKDAHLFTCFKLRTMRMDARPGPSLTKRSDERISRVGRVIRKWRLDEVPQFWNVARGDMRLVGPRPEAPTFVNLDDPRSRRVFRATPGITGLTQLVFISEAALLSGDDDENLYRTKLLPAKIEVDAAYLDRRTARLDLWILIQTLRTIAHGGIDLGAVERQLGRPLALTRSVLSSEIELPK